MTIAGFLLTLIAVFGAAKLCGEVAERIGQPAVLGELVAGVLVGVSGLGLVDPHNETVHLLSELGVILLLFLIGLETDLKKLLAVGGSSTIVAVVGVTVPFALGYAVGVWSGYPSLIAIFLGAALTATSVGITARVLSDLGQLHTREAQVILGAAVLDDVIGLVILSVVSSLAAGTPLTVAGIARITLTAFGFVIVAIVLGGFLAPHLIRAITRLRVSGALAFASLMFAFALAWLAEWAGSAVIIGSFAAGLVLAKTEKAAEIESKVFDISQFFIPIFFVSVGAAIDLRALNPFDPATRGYFGMGLLLSLVAIAGKVVSGWSVVGQPLRKVVIGVGMIPRGEVGLIFAQIGLQGKLLNEGLYGSVALMVIITTFIAPISLRMLLPQGSAGTRGVVGSIVSDAPYEDEPPGQ